MNIMKMSTFGIMLGVFSMAAQAEDEKSVVKLPTMTIMAEPEMSNETGYVPFVQEEKNQRALQHQVMRSSKEAQNFVLNTQVIENLDFQPQVQPDFSKVSPMLQQYVMSIAQGLQSSDPTQGLNIMLQPLGIDRSNSQSAEYRFQLQINPGTIKLGTQEYFNKLSPAIP
ncbi:hypothetical protein BS636_04260 [Acinetobacter sp. LoGeW2-3]|uniref:hypothetical protein n=1 Tax=Acinetobacter sp. LoGeW2-3 TaxID=1808001 RepID=UPI000C059DF8|nr:hypothetical protein [Acinetobacter sp. LoGeW2-3]ATO18929.1 hypothetical protein BS636_04260 [Acinetobacter sp. LoGeW2-3]